jgi:hypothetical protein
MMKNLYLQHLILFLQKKSEIGYSEREEFSFFFNLEFRAHLVQIESIRFALDSKNEQI